VLKMEVFRVAKPDESPEVRETVVLHDSRRPFIIPP